MPRCRRHDMRMSRQLVLRQRTQLRQPGVASAYRWLLPRAGDVRRCGDAPNNTKYSRAVRTAVFDFEGAQ
jgi:hypothetical protein